MATAHRCAAFIAQVSAVRSRASRAATAAAQAAVSGGAGTGAAAPTLLWFKPGDLRLDDHPGLHAALAAGGSLLPVFVFDSVRCAHLASTPAAARSLCRALASLRAGLRARGSDLLLLAGAWEEAVPAAAAAAGAALVVAAAEVDAVPAGGLAATAATLPLGVALDTWRAPLFAGDYPEDYLELQASSPAVLPPLDVPATLHLLPLPVADLLSRFGTEMALVRAAAAATGDGAAAEGDADLPAPEGLAALVAAAGAGAPRNEGAGADDGAASCSEDEEGGAAAGRVIERALAQGASAAGSGWQAWEAEVAAELAAGEGPVLSALGAYLLHLEETGGTDDGSGGGEGPLLRGLAGLAAALATAGADGDTVPGEQRRQEQLQELLAAAIAQHDAPACPGGCFPALFGRALALGVVSRRRVYATAQQLLASLPADAPRPTLASPLALLGWLLTSSGGALAREGRRTKAAAAAGAAVAGDFHEALASRRDGAALHGARLHHWRWARGGGLLTDYLHAAPPAAADGSAAARLGQEQRPAIVLVHGFGAFAEHYRSNLAALAAAGYHVYAPTLPGFGRSEKPALPYSQELWTGFLADFVAQVVRRPVVVVGNSIGGLLSASLAADSPPGTVVCLVLLNSAGGVVLDWQPPGTDGSGSAVAAAEGARRPPPVWLVDALSQGLFSFLRGDVTRLLKWVYPVRPQRADAWLGSEIRRAAHDPGALGVFRSVFFLPKPRPINYLGVEDPLHDAEGRAQELGACCPNVRVQLLDAGHCPHDEVPEQVNDALLSWPARERVRSHDALRSDMAALAEFFTTLQVQLERLDEPLSPKQVAAATRFAQSFLHFMRLHHTQEEEVVFPYYATRFRSLEKPAAAAHAAVDVRANDFDGALSALLDAPTLVEQLAAFAPAQKAFDELHRLAASHFRQEELETLQLMRRYFTPEVHACVWEVDQHVTRKLFKNLDEEAMGTFFRPLNSQQREVFAARMHPFPQLIQRWRLFAQARRFEREVWLPFERYCLHGGSFSDSEDELAALLAAELEEQGAALEECAGYIHAGLEISKREAARLRSGEAGRVLAGRKLLLVLDLDHTLLNSSRFQDLTPEAEGALQARLAAQPADAPELFHLPHMRMWTKLRPGVRMREYAAEMARLLDPERRLFHGGVISAASLLWGAFLSFQSSSRVLAPDSTRYGVKDLDVVLGQEESVLILDDTEGGRELKGGGGWKGDGDALAAACRTHAWAKWVTVGVWPRHRDNLITIERYLYFPACASKFGARAGSLLEQGVDEDAQEGALAASLRVATRVHDAFFGGQQSAQLPPPQQQQRQGQQGGQRHGSAAQEGPRQRQRGGEQQQEGRPPPLQQQQNGRAEHSQMQHVQPSEAVHQQPPPPPPQQQQQGARQGTPAEPADAGNVVLFSRVLPLDSVDPTTHPMWRLATSLGARCCRETGPEVTHVVATDNTDKTRWAKQAGKHVVTPHWLWASLFTWRRADEARFPVEPSSAAPGGGDKGPGGDAARSEAEDVVAALAAAGGGGGAPVEG
eukprot:scaffold7.g3679.t1